VPFYEWACEACHKGEKTFEPKMEPRPPLCSCGAEMERDYPAEARGHRPASGYPYITKNISPDGKPIEVRSPAHEAELCKIHGVVKRDDQAWIEKQHVGHDWKTGQPVYWEPSGRGMPGSWF